MKETTESFIRAEALAAQSSSALGSVMLTTPLSLWLGLSFTLTMLITCAGFLYFGRIPTFVMLSGKLESSKPAYDITLGSIGMVQKFLVEAGQVVKKDENLFVYCHAQTGMADPQCTGPSSTLKSPQQGQIGDIQTRPWEPLRATTSVMSIYRSDQPLVAALRAPETALGNLHVGQRVNLRYSRYNEHSYFDEYGEIIKISNIPIVERESFMSAPSKTDDYRIVVLPQHQTVRDRDTRYALSLNMSVQAKVVIRNARLYEWLWGKF